VTNPPIDPIREEIVMSLASFIGPKSEPARRGRQRRGLTPRLEVTQPVLTNQDLMPPA
jgi:glutamate synthase (NADPH/NADH) large chain